MTTTKNLSVALALLLGATITGCATDAPGGDDGPDVPPLPEDVDASGMYAMHSNFDLAANAPGKAGEVARLIIEATDEGDDPSKWILEQIIKQLPAGKVKDFIAGATPLVAGVINDQLLSLAPDFVGTVIALGNDFGAISKDFGLIETLELTKAGSDYTAVHTITGANFKIDNVDSDYPFADYNVPNVVINDVGVTLTPSSGKLAVADHKVGLKFGQILRIAVDAAIVPSLDPSAANLGELLQNKVDCVSLGESVNAFVVDQIGVGLGPSVFTSACKLGLTAGADLIYTKIGEIDAQALEFGIVGAAKVLDKNADNKVDTIQSGSWKGTLSYAGTPAPLADATFFGSRM